MRKLVIVGLLSLCLVGCQTHKLSFRVSFMGVSFGFAVSPERVSILANSLPLVSTNSVAK